MTKLARMTKPQRQRRPLERNNVANPQLEDGHLRIANDVWYALARTRIPGQARQVFDVVIRKTWGFRKKRDAIALSQFAKATGMTQPHVCRAIKVLIAMNLIVRGERKNVANKGSKMVATYRLQKDYTTWKPLPKRATTTKLPNRARIVAQNGNKSLPKKADTKDNIQKIRKTNIF